MLKNEKFKTVQGSKAGESLVTHSLVWLREAEHRFCKGLVESCCHLNHGKRWEANVIIVPITPCPSLKHLIFIQLLRGEVGGVFLCDGIKDSEVDDGHIQEKKKRNTVSQWS